MTEEQLQNKKSPEKHPTNADIYEMLATIAAIYQLQGVNRFRIIAYQKAAESVELLSRELFAVWQEGRLKELPGFGSSIGESVDELFRTGKATHFEKVLATVPSTLPVLMKVPGIGPKKAYKLITEFSLEDPTTVFSDVLKIAEDDKISELEGFGKKSQTDIQEAVKLYMERGSSADQRMGYPIAYDIYETVKRHLEQLPEVLRIDPMGSLRRGRETIGDVDISVMIDDESEGKESEKAAKIVEHFLAIPGKLAVDNAGDKKASIIFPPHVRVDLRVTSKKQFGAMLQYFTGSKQHNIDLREFALRQNYSLNEYGIKDTKTGELHTFENEESFYNFLGLEYIEPEIREGTQEILAAKKQSLPQLITLEDMKGDFHMHSSYDITTSHDVGANTYEELVDKAVEKGYTYLGFADHNPRQSGLSEKEIVDIMHKRYKHIHTALDAHQKKRGKKLPKWYIGLEVDILPDGALALPEPAFEYVDYLVVSIHSAFNKKREEQTERILKALSYPKVRIFGHPTGRMLAKRHGVEADWTAIYQYAAEKGIAMEINSSPKRLDLSDAMAFEARKAGCLFCIDTDAHAADQMDGMKYGITVARRAWLEPKQVVNTWDAGSFEKWILTK